MKTGTVRVRRVSEVQTHPDSDQLEVLEVAGYRALARKGQFKAGDLVAYAPAFSVLPEWLLKEIGMWDAQQGVGMLAGKAGNVVKAVSYKGQLAEGICLPVGQVSLDATGAFGMEAPTTHYLAIGHEAGPVGGFYVEEGDDVARLLGVSRHSLDAPGTQAGEVFYCGGKFTDAGDVANWREHPAVLAEGEPVVFTERLPGVFTGVSIVSMRDAHPDAHGPGGTVLVYSHELALSGFAFKNDWHNFDNIHVRATVRLLRAIEQLGLYAVDAPLVLHGSAVHQKKAYPDDLVFWLAGASIGYSGQQRHLGYDELLALGEYLEVPVAPVLYRGPFCAATMQECLNGESQVLPGALRNGILITPEAERADLRLGRVRLQVDSPAYLLQDDLY